MLTGVCQWDGVTRRVRGKKLFVLLSVYRLHICTGIESCRWEHMDGNIWMGASGWERGDRSIVTGSIFL